METVKNTKKTISSRKYSHFRKNENVDNQEHFLQRKKFGNLRKAEHRATVKAGKNNTELSNLLVNVLKCIWQIRNFSQI